MIVMKMCMKCADLGHLTAPFETHLRWVTKLEEEFFRQGDREKELMMPISPLMDRNGSGTGLWCSPGNEGFWTTCAVSRPRVSVEV